MKAYSSKPQKQDLVKGHKRTPWSCCQCCVEG